VSPPNLTFFVELARGPLVRLFRDGTCADFLQRGRFALAVGMLDFSPERAELIRSLERRGIPITAWLLLDETHGYWLNADNPGEALARYHALRAWARAEQLELPWIGLDVETPRPDTEYMMRAPTRGFLKLLWRRRSRARISTAEAEYARLVDTIRRDGRRVEAYHLAQVLDERAAGTTLLRRTLGLVNVSVDREVFMLYSTYLGRASSRDYMPEADAIAVGSTGGGVDADLPSSKARHLRWNALESDLLAAAAHSRDLYTFSLEGCVEQDALGRLLDMDWHRAPAPLSAREIRHARRARGRLRTLLRTEPFLDLLTRGSRR
jgi:hypothetical protein